MPQIGQFQRTKSGFSGRIHTLALDAELVLVPAERTDVENVPDYRIHLHLNDGPEVGAAWKHTGEKAGTYLSFQLDDPTFAQSIRANLFQSPDNRHAWTLHWNRPQKRDGRV